MIFFCKCKEEYTEYPSVLVSVYSPTLLYYSESNTDESILAMITDFSTYYTYDICRRWIVS